MLAFRIKQGEGVGVTDRTYIYILSETPSNKRIRRKAETSNPEYDKSSQVGV